MGKTYSNVGKGRKAKVNASKRIPENLDGLGKFKPKSKFKKFNNKTFEGDD